MKLPVVDMSRWSVPRIEVLVDHATSTPQVRVRTVLRDMVNVVTGETMTTVVGVRLLSNCEAAERRRFRAFIKHAILDMLEHELDECLYIDGERLCVEPHPELAKP